MSEHRYSNGKKSYQPNRYKAQLNHQRAMRAGKSEDRTHQQSNNDGYFISSRRFNRENIPVESPRHYKVSPDIFEIGADEKSKNRQSKNNRYSNSNLKQSINTHKKKNISRYSKSFVFDGRCIVLIVAALLILAVIIFTVVQITNSVKNNTESSLQEIQETSLETQNNSQSVTQETNVNVSDTNNFVTPKPEDNNETGTMDNGFYVWNDSIFELFYGSEDTINPYSEAINRYAQKLGSEIKTYTMIIPTHVEMGLPKRFIDSGEVSTNSQSDNIETAYKGLSSSVTPINCYNELANHCNEYIYFRTDHHWTGLGAYYAYKSFAEATNQEVLSLDTCTKQSIEGFSGTLLGDISGSVTKDTVEYWEFPYKTTNNIYYESDGEPTELTVYYSGAEAGTLTYGVFIWGDQPLEVLSSDRGTGRKIAIVKESFSNALVPYFTYNYDEVHVIDFRYWDGNLKSYCEENGITEVLFANGIMSANTSSQIESMDTLF